MVALVDMKGEVACFPVVETGDVDLVVLLAVMLGGEGMTVVRMIGTIIWMVVDVVVDEVDLITEGILLIGAAGAEVVVVVQIGFVHGVTAAGAEAEAGAVGAAAVAGVGVGVGPVATVAAPALVITAATVGVAAAAAAAAMTDMRGHLTGRIVEFQDLMSFLNHRHLAWFQQLLCPQVCGVVCYQQLGRQCCYSWLIVL